MKKKPLILVLVCFAAMFGWIFLAVWLTGGRELSEMNRQDYYILAGMLLLEIMTVAVIFKVGKQLQIQPGGMPAPKPTRADRVRFAWNVLECTAAVGLTVAMELVGVWLHKRGGAEVLSTAKGVQALCWCLAAAALLGNFWAVLLYRRRFQQMDERQKWEFVWSHREQAEKTAAQKLRQLQRIRLATDIYGAALLVLGLILGVCNGCTTSTMAALGSAFLIQLAFRQIPVGVPKAELEGLNDVLPQQDYPRLYGLAVEAAREIGWTGEVRLLVRPDNTVCISLIRNTAVVSLGAVPLGLLNEDELSAMLLHEFSHVSADNKAEIRLTGYANFLQQGRNSGFLSIFNSAFYAFPDEIYGLNFELYGYAASIRGEQAADSAMKKTRSAAACSLLKLKYFDLYLWEAESIDRKPEYEAVEQDVIRQQLSAFHEALPARKADWNRLTKREIEARNATHPTIWARIQALGLGELPEVTFCADGEYGAECGKAIDYMDAQVTAFTQSQFEEAHRSQYLEPKKQVEEWEAAGLPVVAEEYADVVSALNLLGRKTDAIALCDRAIRDLPPIAAAFAYFTRGIWRLHRYDAEGLQDLYTAMELNNNSIEGALDEIGTFCVLTGMQQELDTYREKALELVQHQEERSETGRLTRRDKLSTEHLPEGMLEAAISHMESVSQDSIDAIYLVHKTITDTFFTSAFVIRFRPEVGEEVQEEVMHQIFCYLDTCSDWQFSLFRFEEVPKGLVERVPDSCVYQRE